MISVFPPPPSPPHPVTGSCSVTLKDQTSPEAGGSDLPQSRRCTLQFQDSPLGGREGKARVLLLALLLVLCDLQLNRRWRFAATLRSEVSDPNVVDAPLRSSADTQRCDIQWE